MMRHDADAPGAVERGAGPAGTRRPALTGSTRSRCARAWRRSPPGADGAVTGADRGPRALDARCSAWGSSTSSPCCRSRSSGLAYAVAVVGREHARVQLLLPAARLHADARRLAQLVRAARLRRHRGRRLGARDPVAPAGARGVAPGRDRDLAARARDGRATSSSGSRPRRRGPCRSSGRAISPRPRAGDGRRADRGRPPRRDDPAEGGGDDASARRRLLPALASLLGVAIDRERLAREALEAEALRRADAIKTALLRAVSHDLRTPLMAISTSAGALARARPRDRRRRPRRAARDDPGRLRPARPARREPARPLAPAGGRRAARAAS